jgi:multidrug efflux system membrane fusion protein
VVTVPSTAVRRGAEGLYAWVVTPSDTAETRAIRTGASTDGRTVIVSGLAEGERTVTDGDYKLQPNAPVTIARTAKGAAT